MESEVDHYFTFVIANGLCAYDPQPISFRRRCATGMAAMIPALAVNIGWFCNRLENLS